MPYTIEPRKKDQAIPSFHELLIPAYRTLFHAPPLEAKGDRPLQMPFGHQLKALIFYHLEEYSSGSHLVQALEEDDFGRKEIAPPGGIKKSSFFESVNHRGLEQLVYVFEKLQADAGQTGIMDRYYQCHKDFDLWQTEGKHFVCRIKKTTNKTVIETHPVSSGSLVFYDATVLLGTPHVNQTKKPVRLVGYRVDGKKYWVATDRYDITAEEVACIYKLRWDIEIFFGWWKRHLKVYHLIARSQYGLMVQILAGLITYLLIAIYCHNNFKEKVSIKRVRELRIKIKNEIRKFDFDPSTKNNFKEQRKIHAYAKT